jgi:hypothetical protein
MSSAKALGVSVPRHLLVAVTVTSTWSQRKLRRCSSTLDEEGRYSSRSSSADHMPDIFVGHCDKD